MDSLQCVNYPCRIILIRINCQHIILYEFREPLLTYAISNVSHQLHLKCDVVHGQQVTRYCLYGSDLMEISTRISFASVTFARFVYWFSVFLVLRLLQIELSCSYQCATESLQIQNLDT